ncbi:MULTISPECIES: hypothetical protein [Spirulina sp. CCY15215]|uniref:hypothetical protein n=1 Tax=Spirulina sp. CCY15215 TaxID=2767591 RepID=UPI0019515AC6|nr:hypothetical protein [Spirulina major]
MTLPTIRIFISPCRSGSTAFMQSLNQSPYIHCFYQPVKEGIREGLGPDYRFFDGSHPSFFSNPGKTFFAKEVLGHIYPEECCFQIFPDRDAIDRSRPLFLLREPIATWSSWKKCKAAGKQGWVGVCDLEIFKLAYKYTYDRFIESRKVSKQVTCLTREHLLKAPEQIFQQICHCWEIPFIKEMISWTQPFDVNSFTCGKPLEFFNRIQHKDIRESMSFYRVENNKDRDQEKLVTLVEQKEIKSSLQPLYEDFSNWCQEYYPLKSENNEESSKEQRINTI